MATAIPAPEGDRLRRNAIGLPSAMAMSLAFISPTIGVIFISALIAGEAGASAPFAFIIGTIGVLLMANTLAEFTKRVPSAGTFYSFAARAGGRYVGFIIGWLLFLAYAFQSPINTNLFGYFVPQVLQRDFGIDLTAWWWVFALAIIVFVAWLGYESIKYSLRLDIIFVAFEVLVMAVLLVYIVLTGGAEGQSPQSFTPSLSPGPNATTPLSGVWLAFIFILFAFFGFESSTTVAEECVNPRRNIPIALLGSVGLTGLWFIFALYAVIVGFGPSHMSTLASDPVPLDTLARKYLGSGYAVFIDIAALMANVAVLIAIHNANFRIFYAMGRERVLPSWLGKTHPNSLDSVHRDHRIQRLCRGPDPGHRLHVGASGRVRQQRLLLEHGHPAHLRRDQHPAHHVHVEQVPLRVQLVAPWAPACARGADLHRRVLVQRRALAGRAPELLPGDHRRLGDHRGGGDAVHQGP